MDIAAYCYGTRHGLDIGFFHKDRTDSLAKSLHVGLGKMLAGHELVYPFVGIILRHGGSDCKFGVVCLAVALESNRDT